MGSWLPMLSLLLLVLQLLQLLPPVCLADFNDGISSWQDLSTDYLDEAQSPLRQV
jgi:hypothetical protein